LLGRVAELVLQQLITAVLLLLLLLWCTACVPAKRCCCCCWGLGTQASHIEPAAKCYIWLAVMSDADAASSQTTTAAAAVAETGVVEDVLYAPAALQQEHHQHQMLPCCRQLEHLEHTLQNKWAACSEQPAKCIISPGSLTYEACTYAA
jgi:hypothetical protein